MRLTPFKIPATESLTDTPALESVDEFVPTLEGLGDWFKSKVADVKHKKQQAEFEESKKKALATIIHESKVYVEHLQETAKWSAVYVAHFNHTWDEATTKLKNMVFDKAAFASLTVGSNKKLVAYKTLQQGLSQGTTLQHWLNGMVALAESNHINMKEALKNYGDTRPAPYNDISIHPKNLLPADAFLVKSGYSEQFVPQWSAQRKQAAKALLDLTNIFNKINSVIKTAQERVTKYTLEEHLALQEGASTMRDTEIEMHHEYIISSVGGAMSFVTEQYQWYMQHANDAAELIIKHCYKQKS